MDIQMTRPTIVVGVRDSQRQAIGYALERSLVLRADVRVVHAYRIPRLTLDRVHEVEVEARFVAAGEDILADAKQYARSIGSATTVTYALVRGPAADVLLKEAQCADELVLGPDHSSWVGRPFEGNVCRTVVMNADCPTTVVPEEASLSGHGIIAMVGDGTRHQEVLRYAFAAASVSDEPVRAVHVAPPMTSELGLDSMATRLDRHLERWQHTFPRIKSERMILRGDLRDRAQRLSTESSLVVIGRGQYSGLQKLLTRPAARTLIAAAQCPVVVVPLS